MQLSKPWLVMLGGRLVRAPEDTVAGSAHRLDDTRERVGPGMVSPSPPAGRRPARGRPPVREPPRQRFATRTARSPASAMPFDSISDEPPQHRRELEGVPAVASGDGQHWGFGMATDPEVLIRGVTVETAPGVYDRRIRELRERVAEERAQVAARDCRPRFADRGRDLPATPGRGWRSSPPRCRDARGSRTSRCASCPRRRRRNVAGRSGSGPPGRK